MRIRVRSKDTGETFKLEVSGQTTVADLLAAVRIRFGEQLLEQSDNIVISLNKKVRFGFLIREILFRDQFDPLEPPLPAPHFFFRVYLRAPLVTCRILFKATQMFLSPV